MTAKDFLNYKKPHFWVALIAIIVLIFAGVVAVLDKEEPVESVDVPPAEEVAVEVEEVPEEPKKTESQIIIERFSSMDWEDVKKNAKDFGEDGWEKGIVILAKLPNEKITLYGYNDEEYQLKGVAIAIGELMYNVLSRLSSKKDNCLSLQVFTLSLLIRSLYM